MSSELDESQIIEDEKVVNIGSPKLIQFMSSKKRQNITNQGYWYFKYESIKNVIHVFLQNFTDYF